MSLTRCPKCRFETELSLEGDFTTTCPMCESRLISKADEIIARPGMATVAQNPIGLAVGWPTQLKGQTIQVHGRIQYRYESGYWDEFHVEFPGGKFGWITVDQGRYLLQRQHDVKLDLANLKRLDAGQTVGLMGDRFQVKEIGFATMVGMQGRLPFVVDPEEIMHYIDLENASRKISVEIFRDESYLVFEGTSFQPSELEAANDERRTVSPFQKIYSPPVFDALESTPSIPQPSLTNRCPKCGEKIEPKFSDTKTYVCRKCGKGLDLADPNYPRELFDATKRRISVPIRNGAECLFDDVRYRVSGRVKYRQKASDGTYFWTACQLIPVVPGSGEPVFLENEDDHWSLFRTTSSPVARSPGGIVTGDSVVVNETTFDFAERGHCEIVAVDGELTWQAKIGDRLNFVDLVCVPQVVSAEWTRNEIEWSLGTYLDRSEVAEAFGMPVHELHQPRNYLAHQPFRTTINHRICFWAGLACTLFMSLMAYYATTFQGERIFSDSVSSQTYLSDQGYLSDPIVIPSGDHICKFSASSSRLHNQWVSFSILFLDEDERVLLDEDSTVEKYYGQGWQEGSKSTYRLIKLTGPRKYRINLFGETGSWSQAGGDQIRASGPPISIQLDRGVKPAMGWIVGAMLAFVYPCFRMIKSISFASGKAEWLSEDDD